MGRQKSKVYHLNLNAGDEIICMFPENVRMNFCSSGEQSPTRIEFVGAPRQKVLRKVRKPEELKP